jgi:hypothetical protein
MRELVSRTGDHVAPCRTPLIGVELLLLGCTKRAREIEPPGSMSSRLAIIDSNPFPEGCEAFECVRGQFPSDVAA